MENQVRETLAKIVQQYGMDVIDDPAKVQGLLKDLAGQHRREINLLMSALRAGVPQDLNSSSGPIAITADRLSVRLREETGLAEDAANWAVETWAAAIGIEVHFAVSAPPANLPGESVVPNVTSSEPPYAAQTVVPSTPISNPISPTPTSPIPPSPIQQNPVPPQREFAPVAIPTPARKSSTPIIAAVVALAVFGGAFVFMRSKGNAAATTTGGGQPTPTNSSGPSPTVSPTQTSMPSPPPSPTPVAQVGSIEDGWYFAGDRSFKFFPPANWKFKVSNDSSVQWEHPDGENSGIMDLRVVQAADGMTLDQFAENAKKILNEGSTGFKVQSVTDQKLGTEMCKLLFGTITLPGSVPGKSGVILALKNGQAVVLTVGSTNETFDESVKDMDRAIDSWTWLK
jgi:hypothetical protein